MPNVFLSPSTQEWNPYVNGGNEEFYMNQIADRMEPYLRSSGISYTAAGKRKAARMDTGINTVPTMYIVCALPGVQRRKCRRRK